MESTVEKPPRSWLRTHWKLAVALWLGVVFSGAIAGIVLTSHSEVAKLAVRAARSNPKMADRLGQPLKRGWFVSGSVEVTPASGYAELAIPISGPKGSGTLYTEARKRAGLWRLDMLQFGTEGSTERLDLLQPAEMTPTPTTAPR